jgi:CO/xanthine dehydrogenase FAD-binding subunit
MRAALGVLDVVRPRTLEEALGHAAAAPARMIPLAGGTDLFVYLNAGTQEPASYLDLNELDELRGIEVGRKGVTIRALTTFHDLRRHTAIRRRFPSLAQAASEIGAIQIQNRATIAGNIANASPAGDSLPVLLAHDAEVTVQSIRAERTIPFTDLYTAYRKLAIDPDELITAIHIPFPPANATPFFRKVGTRLAQSISKVVFAGVIAKDSRRRITHVRLAYGSVAATTIRARAAEQTLQGERPSSNLVEAAQDALAADVRPIDDIRSDAEYRTHVARALLAQFLRASDKGFTRR